MGKHSERKQIPADKLAENMPPALETKHDNSLLNRWRTFRENGEKLAEQREEAEAKRDRKIWNWFRKTPVGKLWVALRNNLRKSKAGRIVLTAIYLGLAALMFAIVPLARIGLDAYFGAQVGHTDLTQAQIDQGYVEPCTGSKSCSPSGAGYRILSDSEALANPNCTANAESCISVITLQRECTSVTTMIYEYAKESDWFEANTVFLKNYPTGSKNFAIGTKLVVPITGLTPTYEAWSIDQVRCDY